MQGRRRRSQIANVAREKIIEPTVPNEFTAVFAAARTEINQIIRGADDLLLVLDHQQRIAFVTQIMHHAHQLADIARM